MSIQSPSLHIVKALTKELRPSALGYFPSAWPRHRRLVANNYYSLTAALSDVVSNDHYFRRFSTKPEEASGLPSSKGEATSPPNTEDGSKYSTIEGAAIATDADVEGAKVADLEKQVKDLKDNLLRSLAEQENTRRIAQRDMANAKSYAITSFAKSLLDTSDNLTRALDAVPEELRHDRENNPVLANLYEGISMTDESLTKAFASNGLRKYGARGEKFDPNLHEALFEYPDQDGEEPGNIGQVMKVGFMLNDRVVRPAEVGVVKAP